jgi:hypothetical protein
MKWISLFIFAVSIPSFASNPLIHACNLTGGAFHVLQIDDDQVGFCKYGPALIDSLSVLEITSDQRTSTAAKLALSAGSDCADSGDFVSAQDLEGVPFSICRFSDGSSLEIKTLQSGADSSSNAKLVHALKMRF